MTKLEAITLAFMQIPMTEDRRMELHKRVKEAEEEQGELVAAIVSMYEAAAALYDEETTGRVVILVDAIEIARSALARFHSPAPTGATGPTG